MSINCTHSLEAKLLAFLREMSSTKEHDNYDADCEAFVFHTTDWQSELAELQRLFSHPDDFDQSEANKILQNLFYHILPHLNAAAEIYDDATTIYKMHNKPSADNH